MGINLTKEKNFKKRTNFNLSISSFDTVSRYNPCRHHTVVAASIFMETKCSSNKAGSRWLTDEGKETMHAVVISHCNGRKKKLYTKPMKRLSFEEVLLVILIGKS